MKQFVCALAVISLSMMGCGGSLCEDFADSSGSLKDKVADCPSYKDVTFEEPTEAEIAQCEKEVESCTEKDKEILSKFVDCINGLDKCVASSENAFTLSFAACASPLENVSDACGEATSGQNAVVRKGLAYSKAR